MQGLNIDLDFSGTKRNGSPGPQNRSSVFLRESRLHHVISPHICVHIAPCHGFSLQLLPHSQAGGPQSSWLYICCLSVCLCLQGQTIGICWFLKICKYFLGCLPRNTNGTGSTCPLWILLPSVLGRLREEGRGLAPDDKGNLPVVCCKVLRFSFVIKFSSSSSHWIPPGGRHQG